MKRVQFIKASIPNPSSLFGDLEAIYGSGVFSNYGPVNTRFEQGLTSRIFDEEGASLSVCNATLGLMIAMKLTARQRPRGYTGPRFALMPAFTFAAAAQAALWAGFTPLCCDIDAQSWAACPESEDRMIAQYGDQIDLVVPYATFGNCIDLARYEAIHQATGAGIVIDAAASLGALDEDGRAFGAGFRHPVVYSMHATKTFGIGEGGVIYCGDEGVIATLRQMGNFGFGELRSATMPGMNTKLSEVAAAFALRRLDDIEVISARRDALAGIYRRRLGHLETQAPRGVRPAHQFFPFLVPNGCGLDREAFRAELRSRGIETGAYFSPHLMQMPLFQEQGRADVLPRADDIAGRIVSLPLWNGMSDEMVEQISDMVLDVASVETKVSDEMDLSWAAISWKG